MGKAAVKVLQIKDNHKKCNALTCIHYACGFCVCCEGEDECEFLERSLVQD